MAAIPEPAATGARGCSMPATQDRLPTWLQKAIRDGRLGHYAFRDMVIGRKPMRGHESAEYPNQGIVVDFAVVRFGPISITVEGENVPLDDFTDFVERIRKEV